MLSLPISRFRPFCVQGILQLCSHGSYYKCLDYGQRACMGPDIASEPSAPHNVAHGGTVDKQLFVASENRVLDI